MTAVRDAVVAVAGVGAEAVWVYLSEIPPARMVEFGQVLPEPGGEAAWTAGLPAAAAALVGHLDGGTTPSAPR